MDAVCSSLLLSTESASTGAAVGKQKETVNSVPLPTWLVTSIVPSIMSTMLFVIERPSPVPWIPLTVAVSSRSKGSNRCFRNVWLMPIPVSWIRNW